MLYALCSVLCALCFMLVEARGSPWKPAEARGSIHINAYKRLINAYASYYKSLLRVFRVGRGRGGGCVCVEVSLSIACCCQKYRGPQLGPRQTRHFCLQYCDIAIKRSWDKKTFFVKILLLHFKTSMFLPPKKISIHTQKKNIGGKMFFVPIFLLINVHCFVFRAGNSGLRLDRES
jgi:hypothetical protein